MTTTAPAELIPLKLASCDQAARGLPAGRLAEHPIREDIASAQRGRRTDHADRRPEGEVEQTATHVQQRLRSPRQGEEDALPDHARHGNHDREPKDIAADRVDRRRGQIDRGNLDPPGHGRLDDPRGAVPHRRGEAVADHI